MRDILPEEIELSTLKYNGDASKGSVGYYVHMKFTKPLFLEREGKPVSELCTLVQLTPEFAIRNFEKVFSSPSEADKVKKRTLIDTDGFVY